MILTANAAVQRHRALQRRQKAAGQAELFSTSLARIVGIVIIIAIVGMGVEQLMSSNSSAGQTEIQTIDNLVASEYGNLGVYTGLTDAVLIGTGHLPSNWYSGTGAAETLQTPWHDKIALAVAATNPVTGLANGAWTLTMPDTPSGECNDLAVDHFSGQLGLTIGTGTAGSTSGLTFTPPTPAEAEASCGGAAASGTAAGKAQMVYEFGGN